MPQSYTSFRISEPVTMLTDYALAIQCFVQAWLLMRVAPYWTHGTVRLWVIAFLITALAAVAGGSTHGFALHLGKQLPAAWGVTKASIAGGAVAFLVAGVQSARRPAVEDRAARQEGYFWLKMGLGITLIGLLVLATRLSLHTHFNQNDLYHVIQMAGIYCFYRAAVELNGL